MNQLAQQNLVVIEGRATYERIVSALREVEMEEGLRQIQNFLKVYPEFAQAHNDLAVLYYQAGNSLKALAHYEKAHKLDPSNITFRKNLADFYHVELEWSDDAIHTYLDILKDNPFDVESLNALGTICVQVGRREQARQYFTRTLELDAVNSQARQALQQLGGQLAPAAQLAQLSQPAPPLRPAPAQVANDIQPRPTAEQLHRQALELAGSGNSNAARALLEELLAQQPQHAVGHNDLGIVFQQLGDLAAARRHQEEALRLQPDNINFRKNLADLLFIGCGETAQALELYVAILKRNPQDLDALKAISQICIENGQLDDARSFLQAILKVEPWNSDAREALARLDAAAAREPASFAAGRSADEMYAEAQQLLAQADGLPAAQALLEELVRQYPQHALAHNDLGVIRFQRGDVDGSRRAYERAVELQPENRNFRKNLADLYFVELGLTDQAIAIYLELFREQPRDVETLSGLGHICAAIGRTAEAKSFYQRALEIEPWNMDAREALRAL